MPTVHHPQLDAADFAERLKEAMEDCGISTKRGAGTMLAKKYGTSIVTANAWLKGEHRADTDRARQMADDLSVEFEWLYFGKPPKHRKHHIAEDASTYEGRPLSRLEREILDLYRKAPVDVKDLARMLLKAAPVMEKLKQLENDSPQVDLIEDHGSTSGD